MKTKRKRDSSKVDPSCYFIPIESKVSKAGDLCTKVDVPKETLCRKDGTLRNKHEECNTNPIVPPRAQVVESEDFAVKEALGYEIIRQKSGMHKAVNCTHSIDSAAQSQLMERKALPLDKEVEAMVHVKDITSTPKKRSITLLDVTNMEVQRRGFARNTIHGESLFEEGSFDALLESILQHDTLSETNQNIVTKKKPLVPDYLRFPSLT